VLFCLGLAACNGPSRPSQPTGEGSSGSDEIVVEGMDAEQQAFLWDIEHHGNILGRIGFPAFTKALRDGDATALAPLLAPNFRGGLLREPYEAAVHNEFLDIIRQSDSGQPPLAVDGKQFLAKLLEYRTFFKHEIKGGKLSLMKLRPTDEKNLAAPWRGTAQLRLWGERAPGQPAEAIVYLAYETVRPTKEAMEKGNWLLGCTITQSQVGSSRHFLMRESAAERGLEPDRLHDNWRGGPEHRTVTGGVFLCDFNRDGRLDILITDTRGYFLYENLGGGKFRNVTAEYGLPAISPDADSRSLVAAWIDIDGDGWEDLILGKYIFRNVQGRRFQDVTSQSNLRLTPDVTGLAVADYDSDGRIDLYAFQPGKGKASSWLNGKGGNAPHGGNRLFRNTGDWQFEDVTAASGTDGGDRSTFTALWLDANDDGKPDLYVPNEFGNGVLYVNNGDGTFRPTSLTDAPCDFGTMGATCGDVNNDGRIDIYCGNMYSKAGSRIIGNVREGTYPRPILDKMKTFVRGSQLHLNRGNGNWEQKGHEWQVNDAGWAYGPALIDLDNDGWLDIHAACGFVSRDRNEPDG
jgi:hypothetical protein